MYLLFNYSAVDSKQKEVLEVIVFENFANNYTWNWGTIKILDKKAFLKFKRSVLMPLI